MRSVVIVVLLSSPLAAQEPVDVGAVLRESKEFREKLEEHKVTFDHERGLVTAVGQIVYRGGGPCEYLVGIWPSKAHETVVLLDHGPWEGEGRQPRRFVDGLASTLNNALLAAGFRPGSPFAWDHETGEVFPPKGPTVHVYAEWTDEEGETRRARMADWLWNFKTRAVMQPGKLVYTGSNVYEEGPPTNKTWFGAEVDGLVVAVLNTSSAIVDNVEDGGLDNGAYEAIPTRIPPSGTRVRVLFSRDPLDGVEEYPPMKLPEEQPEPQGGPFPGGGEEDEEDGE